MHPSQELLDALIDDRRRRLRTTARSREHERTKTKDKKRQAGWPWFQSRRLGRNSRSWVWRA